MIIFALLLLAAFDYQKSDGPFSVQLTTNTEKMDLNQTLTLSLSIHHPQDKPPLWKKLTVIQPDAKGIYPFFFKDRKVTLHPERTEIVYLLEPQYSGILTLDPGDLSFPGAKIALPKIPITVAQGKERALALSLAPLMPLVRGDPLELNLPLRHLLYKQNQSQRNQEIFKKYTFPWLKLLTLLAFMLLLPFLLYVLRAIYRREDESRPAFYTLLSRLQALQSSTMSPKELIFAAAKLFKMSFPKGSSMTYQELIAALKANGGYSEEEVEAFEKQFRLLEKLQYQEKSPVQPEVLSAVNRMEALIPRNQ